MVQSLRWEIDPGDAKMSAFVAGGAAEAIRTLTDALAAGRGKLPGPATDQPIRFRVASRIMTYDGTARFVPVSDGHTRIDIEVKPTPAALVFYRVATVVSVLLAVYFDFFGPKSGHVRDLATLFWLLVGFSGWGYYQGTELPTRKVADQLADQIVSRGTVRQPAVGPALTTSAVDQLKKLAELHAAGILTDTEFAEKKAEVLKRI